MSEKPDDDKSIVPLADRLAWSPEEYGELIGAGRTFVFGEIKSGRLRARKAGRLTRINRPDGLAYLATLPEARP
jgi:hypothetical protein